MLAPRPRHPAGALAFATVLGGGLVLSACSGHPSSAAPRRRHPTVSVASTTAAARTTPTTGAPETASTTHPADAPSTSTSSVRRGNVSASPPTHPATSPSVAVVPESSTTEPAGNLPQTTTLPSANSPQFLAAIRVLFSAIASGVPQEAMVAFFPERAYVRLKAISDPAADYTSRLVADYDADIEAAHHFLGPGAARATFAGVTVPVGEAAWIPPGYCYNSIGYWHDPGARLDYRVDGQLRSIGIASLISWRGEWYVVHLGAVLRSGHAGIVDSPAAGAGVAGAPGGC